MTLKHKLLAIFFAVGLLPILLIGFIASSIASRSLEQQTFDYYDLFLIDQSGSIFYTVTREPDYQTNLINGRYKDSGLGQLFRQVISSGQYGLKFKIS